MSSFIVEKSRTIVLVALWLLLSSPVHATPPTSQGETTSPCYATMQKLWVKNLLGHASNQNQNDGLLYQRYMQKGGLLRSRAFQQAAIQMWERLNDGSPTPGSLDREIKENPKVLAQNIWSRLKHYYDLPLGDLVTDASSDQAKKGFRELEKRRAITGESQAGFLARAREVFSIDGDPAKRAEVVNYIEKIFPDYGRIAIRNGLWRNLTWGQTVRRFLGLTVLGPLVIPFDFFLNFSTEQKVGMMSEINGDFNNYVIAKWKDFWFTRKAKRNRSLLDVESLALQYGLDPNLYSPMFAGGKEVYEPYQKISDGLSHLDLKAVPQEFSTSTSFGDTADRLSEHGSKLTSVALPLRTEILRRSNQLLAPERLMGLDKALRTMEGTFGTVEKAPQVAISSLLDGAVTLRIEELRQQATDLTQMSQDLRKVRDLASVAHATGDEVATKIYAVLEKSPGVDNEAEKDHFQDLYRIHGEVENFKMVAESLGMASVSIDSARALVQAELNLLRKLRNTIAVNPGGHTGLAGQALVETLEKVKTMIADRKQAKAPAAIGPSRSLAAESRQASETAVAPQRMPLKAVAPPPASAEKEAAPQVKPRFQF